MSVMTRYAFPEPIVEALPADALASASPHARFARLALTTLTHDEHGPITLEPGVYKVRIQREYSPEAIHNVAD